MTSGRRVPARLVAAACTLGGAVLFAWVVRRTGPADILDGIQRVGWGLLAILALAGLRLALRAAAWQLCMAPGAGLTYGRAFSAMMRRESPNDRPGGCPPSGALAGGRFTRSKCQGDKQSHGNHH